MNLKIEVLNALKIIKENGPRYRSEGICNNVWLTNKKLVGSTYGKDVLIPLFKKWPEFSGDYAHPVTVSKMISPRIQFRLCSGLWGADTEYGKARYRLLDFLIEELEKELNQCSHS